MTANNKYNKTKYFYYAYFIGIKKELYTEVLGDGNKIPIIGQVFSVTSGKFAKF